LKPQEIRNCVFIGELSRLLKKLNEDKNWRKILGKKTLDKHQKDVELILRIFSLSGNWNNYIKPMKEFLNTNMQKERKGKSVRVKNFIENFSKATKIIVEKFGEKPFHLRGPLNSAALDSIFCTVLSNLEQLPKDVDLRYKKLIADENFKQATFYSTSDETVLKKRFELAENYLIR